MGMERLPRGWESWHVTDVLGEGSYGVVYRAEKRIGPDVTTSAIKVITVPSKDHEVQILAAQLGNKESARKYYQDLVNEYIQEIRAMEALKGITNIVSIEDYAVEEDQDKFTWNIYIRMEYLTPFPEYIQTHPVTEEMVVQLGIDICTALMYCEKANIIHRDIKPSNLFVSSMDHFKLGDFGVARKLDHTSGIYSTKGTFPFMAPEVFHGQAYDHRADLYSLGLVLYQLMNHNREPFADLEKQIIYQRDREEASARRMSGEQLPPPADASPALAEVILKACSPEEDKRFSDAAAFRSALEKLHGEKSQSESTASESRKKGPWFITAILILLALVLGGWTLMNHSKDSNESKTVSIPIEEPGSTLREIDISQVRIAPYLLGNRLYEHPMVPVKEVEKQLADGEIVFKEPDKTEFEGRLKSQFVFEGNEKIGGEEPFAEGDTILMVYRPEDDFLTLTLQYGFEIRYDSRTFQLKKEKDGNRLRFEPVVE